MTNIIPRHQWLKNRILECLEEIKRLDDVKDWKKYIKDIEILGKELVYASTIWDKYYEDKTKDNILLL